RNSTNLMFISLIPSAEAFDGGDAVALLLGVTISVVGVCALCYLGNRLSFHEILTLPCQVNCHLSTVTSTVALSMFCQKCFHRPYS
uniref:Uncharacterized protein n=1 Tax=Hucho hucho TaxID=62062 RepID=A0A4W5NME6_9TELE